MIQQVLIFEFQNFRILENLNFHPCVRQNENSYCIQAHAYLDRLNTKQKRWLSYMHEPAFYIHK